jgi:hypothetical protein
VARGGEEGAGGGVGSGRFEREVRVRVRGGRGTLGKWSLLLCEAVGRRRCEDIDILVFPYYFSEVISS